MTQEEKAKAYDEALERAMTAADKGFVSHNFVTEIFALESEDERIRKSLVEFLDDVWHLGKNVNFDRWSKADCADWIAYLEKQEHIATEAYNKGFADGTVAERESEELEKQKEQKDYNKLYEDISKSEWFKKEYEGKSLGCDYVQKEQNPAEEGLFDTEKMINGLIEGITNLASPSNYGDSITFGGFNWKDCVAYLKKLNSENIKKYTFTDMQESYKRGHLKGEEVGREQMMIEIQRDHDGEEWMNPDDFTAHIRQAYQDGFREGVESVKPAEWSEEDEIYLQDALWCVKQASKVARGENDMGACWSAERWLKSLRPQSHWKPSEEQMTALKLAYEDAFECPESCVPHLPLKDLLNDLKKL